MLLQPGTGFMATAYLSGKYSNYRGAALHWQTFMHELAHNFGINHAGGLTAAEVYEEYQDDAIMGFQRNSRLPDYTAAARYHLGWIREDQVAHYPHVSRVTLRALNERLLARTAELAGAAAPSAAKALMAVRECAEAIEQTARARAGALHGMRQHAPV